MSNIWVFESEEQTEDISRSEKCSESKKFVPMGNSLHGIRSESEEELEN